MVLVYYITISSLCQFGPPNLNECYEFNPIVLQVTIIDSNIPDRIRLPYANRLVYSSKISFLISYFSEVFRLHPMKKLNRYVHRTFYYVDEIDQNNEVIRLKPIKQKKIH